MRKQSPLVSPRTGRQIPIARLPLRGAPASPPRKHPQIIIASHLILHGYGHWLANDPRGSGSTELRESKFEDLGEIHFGRQSVQPPRYELKSFYRDATPRLAFEPLWFDAAKRQAIALAFAQVIASEGYTVWACAILSKHAHLCIRRHRDHDDVMWSKLAAASRAALMKFPGVDPHHRIWSSRPYAVFLHTPEEVRIRVPYIEQNPAKENLPPQRYDFVKPYDGWPYRKY